MEQEDHSNHLEAKEGLLGVGMILRCLRNEIQVSNFLYNDDNNLITLFVIYK
jgi:hypothetical protein